eukprot:TRINITY_DN1536_c0_g2_i1.p1 TRINITY_DN1536_c0_g2~~TRINITY_DN1536_c0_g2_i1.p1  ORF type:complete len:332 (+),score=103.63 TRINITY_DN1536_c0_g2_i1:51-1046(+)
MNVTQKIILIVVLQLLCVAVLLPGGKALRKRGSPPQVDAWFLRIPLAPPEIQGTCPGDDPMVYAARTENVFYLCTHGANDTVSSYFASHGFWFDCPSLERVIAALKRILKLQTLDIVEVGSNIGTCTWVMATSGAHVTAFEPVHKNFVLLNYSSWLNTRYYGPRVVPINKGCGSRQHTATVKSEKGNMGNSVAMMNHTEEQMKLLLEGRQAEWEEHKIEITTLDSVVSKHVHFMKMDCQGHEIEALLGARRLLAVHGVDVIKAEFFSDFLRSSGHEPRELLDILEEHGYDVLCNGRMVLPEQFEAFQHNRKTDILAVKRGVLRTDVYSTLQ